MAVLLERLPLFQLLIGSFVAFDSRLWIAPRAMEAQSSAAWQAFLKLLSSQQSYLTGKY